LTAGSLGGAVLIFLLGWFTFSSLNQATSDLERESKEAGESSEEYSDVQAFLQTTRNIFVSLEIYPRNYPGIFNVTKESMVLAKESLNKIAKYPLYPGIHSMANLQTIINKKVFNKLSKQNQYIHNKYIPFTR